MTLADFRLGAVMESCGLVWFGEKRKGREDHFQIHGGFVTSCRRHLKIRFTSDIFRFYETIGSRSEWTKLIRIEVEPAFPPKKKRKPRWTSGCQASWVVSTCSALHKMFYSMGWTIAYKFCPVVQGKRFSAKTRPYTNESQDYTQPHHVDVQQG